jgi:hypothetical protein
MCGLAGLTHQPFFDYWINASAYLRGDGEGEQMIVGRWMKRYLWLRFYFPVKFVSLQVVEIVSVHVQRTYNLSLNQ